jgi:adenine-specific DNA-methyltransferase
MVKKSNKVTVKTLKHEKATRKNIPTVEYQSVMAKEVESTVQVAYERGAKGLEKEKQDRNRDLDPQLVWRGKDEKDWSDLVVQAPPLYIQEKVHPKVLIDDLLRRSQADKKAEEPQYDLFADFNGLPSETARTEFYQHDANWSNRMILATASKSWHLWPNGKACAGRCSVSISIPPTVLNLILIFSGLPPAATLRTRPITLPVSRSR